MDVRPDQIVYYTDKMLTENFINVDQALRALSSRITHLEGHVEEVSKVTAIVAKQVMKSQRSRKLPFVAGAVIGVYLYRKFQGAGWQVEVGNGMKIDTSHKKDANYTVKDNGQSDQDTDRQPPSA